MNNDVQESEKTELLPTLFEFYKENKTKVTTSTSDCDKCSGCG
ncbi:MAG: hypothetical protein Q7J65_09405 [Candidatus Marinimicrobia bacterium]|nr:hypothetical protein [Candidatus Neomarinimicrobiota bacterium]